MKSVSIQMIYCAGLSMEDFYVIHHEMGHIEYYMSYDKNLPTIFQDGVNSAFQESVGDSIMYAVLTPQHLQRLGLIQDKLVYIYPKQKIHKRQPKMKHYNKEERNLLNFGQGPVQYDRQLESFWRIPRNVELLTQKLMNVDSNPSSIENTLEKLVTNMQEHLENMKEFLSKYVKVSPYKTVDAKADFNDNSFNDIYKTGYAEEPSISTISDNINKHDIIARYGNLDNDQIKERYFNTIDNIKRRNSMGVNNKIDNLKDIDFDTILLLRQALSKLPQVPFGFLIDKYRWDIFSGKIHPNDYNKAFWRMVRNIQGIQPPNGEIRGEQYFDAGSKFHIPDNTPYVRYFLSSFLQVQMFRGMCKLSLFGDTAPHRELPMPLHRCDIYGSKKAGKKLREMMSKGSSIHWSEALNILTGESTVSSSALLQYFQPLHNILNKIITKYNIPIGW